MREARRRKGGVERTHVSAPSTGHNLLEGALEKQREVGKREGMLGIEALVPMDGFGEQQVPYRQATRHGAGLPGPLRVVGHVCVLLCEARLAFWPSVRSVA